MKRIAITGVGIIDPLGANKEECFSNLLNDFNPVEKIKTFNIDDYENIQIKIGAQVDVNKCQVADPGTARAEPYKKLAMHAIEQALAMAGNPERQTTNASVLFSSLGTSGDTRVNFSVAIEQRKKRYSPRDIMENLPDYLSGYIARTYKFTGTATGMNAACATALVSIDYAAKMLDTNDFVIVGGSDCMIDTTHMFSFQAIQALSHTGTRPFDLNRDGFVMGEGAGCLILESEEKAKARGAKILAYIDGVAVANDFYSPTSPDPEGKGAESAMKQAWMQAGSPHIDFVNAHATSTPVGDAIEYEAIKRLFPDAAIYSSKGKVGHTMGGCGIIELIHGLGSFDNNVVPKTFNLTDSIAPNDPLLLTKNKEQVSKTFIKNSFGFGGRCASVVVSKE